MDLVAFHMCLTCLELKIIRRMWEVSLFDMEEVLVKVDNSY